LINGQVEIGLLLATPGLLLVMALGPVILQLLYSSEFVAAFELLRWQVFGTFFRVLNWPLGYLMLAQGKGRLFFWTQFLVNVVYLGAAWLGIHHWGLVGVSIAFVIMYVFHAILVNVIASRLVDFRWTHGSKRLLAILLPSVLAGLLCSLYLPSLVALWLCLGLAVGIGLYSLRTLYKLVGPSFKNALFQRFGLHLQ
jgi:PST family polysaccharide transporter